MSEKNRTVSIDSASILRVIFFGVAVFLVFVLSDLILVLLTAIVLASFIESVVAKLAPYKIPRTVSVIFVYLISLGVIAGFLYMFVPVFVSELSSLLELLNGSSAEEHTIFSNLSPDTLDNAQDFISSISGGLSMGDFVYSLENLVSGVSGGVVDTASYLFGSVVNVVLVAVITFYLSVEERGIEYVLRILTPEQHENYVINLWKRSERKIGLWLQGQIMLGLIVGVLVYFGLILLNIKYALLLAIMAAVFEIIPFGIVLAGLTAIVFAYISGGLEASAKVFALYMVIQQFEAYLIAPLIVKKVTGVSPLIVILSVLAGAKIAGFWGVVLAVPAAVCMLEYLDDLEKGKAARLINE